MLQLQVSTSHVNVHKTHLRCQNNTLYFRPCQEDVHRPHQTPFHCHQLFPKHFGNHQPSRAQPITLLRPKNGCIYLPDSASGVRYHGILPSESAVCTVHFLVTILLISHVNVHKTHLRCQNNTLYFRPCQGHVHRPHQTPFHCHQLFPKHFGNHQPSRAQPITLLQPKNGCIYFA